MSLNVPVVLLIAGLAGFLAWLVLGSRAGTGSRRKHHHEIDDELRAAEDEVRDLDRSVTPDEADDHLPDWGPGAPRTPR